MNSEMGNALEVDRCFLKLYLSSEGNDYDT
jgi:hypothetical protein